MGLLRKDATSAPELGHFCQTPQPSCRQVRYGNPMQQLNLIIEFSTLNSDIPGIGLSVWLRKIDLLKLLNVSPVLDMLLINHCPKASRN